MNEEYPDEMQSMYLKKLQAKMDDLSARYKDLSFYSNKSLEEKIELLRKDVFKDIEWLLKHVRDGNGKPSLISSLQEMQSKYNNLEKELHDRIEDMEKNINLKFNVMDSKFEKMENNTKMCIQQMASDIKEYWDEKEKGREAKNFEKSKIDRAGMWNIKGRIIAAIVAVVIGSLGSLLTFAWSSYNESQKYQSQLETMERQEANHQGTLDSNSIDSIIKAIEELKKSNEKEEDKSAK